PVRRCGCPEEGMRHAILVRGSSRDLAELIDRAPVNTAAVDRNRQGHEVRPAPEHNTPRAADSHDLSRVIDIHCGRGTVSSLGKSLHPAVRAIRLIGRPEKTV